MTDIQLPYSTLKRGTYMKKRKSKNRITKDGRVILANTSELRKEVCERAGARCEIERDGTRCFKYAPLEGHPMFRGQLCHWPPKKMGNSQGSDTPETTLWGCRECHDWLDNRNQKVVPPKSGSASAGIQT